MYIGKDLKANYYCKGSWLHYHLSRGMRFEQFEVLTSVDSDEPLQPFFKLRNSKWYSVSSLQIIEYSGAYIGSDQAALMRRLIWGFDSRTYHIVGNLMHWLIC